MRVPSGRDAITIMMFSSLLQGAEPVPESAAPPLLPFVEVTRYVNPETSTGFSLSCESAGTVAKENRCLVTRYKNGKPESTDAIHRDRANDVLSRFMQRLPTAIVQSDGGGGARSLNVENETLNEGGGLRVTWRARGAGKVTTGTVALSEVRARRVDVDRDLVLDALSSLDRDLPGARK